MNDRTTRDLMDIINAEMDKVYATFANQGEDQDLWDAYVSLAKVGYAINKDREWLEGTGAEVEVLGPGFLLTETQENFIEGIGGLIVHPGC